MELAMRKLEIPQTVQVSTATLYYRMWLVRYFDEKLEELLTKNLIYGTTHLCVGQEATAVGGCAVLRPDDKIVSNHRGHGHCIGKGADVNRMMAEILGRATGYCDGKGGTMHLSDMDKGIIGETGIVGGGLPLAAGAALTSKMMNKDYVVLCYFGDGATNEGSFHEAVNLAAIWRLPVVFLCENNQYAMSSSVHEMLCIDDIAVRAASYGIPGKTIDGNDIFSVMSAVDVAVNRARQGEGPSLLEAKTYRWKGHSRSDKRAYRTREEEASWKQCDAIVRFEEALLRSGAETSESLSVLKQKAHEAVESAVAFAKASPAPRLDSLEQGLYA